MCYTDSDNYFKYTVCKALTLRCMRIGLVKIKKGVNTLFKGSGRIKTRLVGIYTDFKDNSDHLVKIRK